MAKLIPVPGAPFWYAILSLADLTEPLEARLPAYVTEADVLLTAAIAAGGDELVTVAGGGETSTWLRIYSRPVLEWSETDGWN